MSRMLAALLFLMSTRPDVLIGQTSAMAPLQPGARVRVTLAGEKPRVGIFVARRADTLIVRWPEFANTISLPLSGISRLDVSTGRHRNVVKGMVLGTVGAGAVGFLVGAAAYQPCTSNCFLAPTSAAESGMVGGIVLGTVGLVVGTLAGLPSRDTWQRVSLGERRVAVGLSPTARGATLGVTLRY